MAVTDIVDWLFGPKHTENDDERFESVKEEYNRYGRAPKGISEWTWFILMERAKYGDIISGKRWKTIDD